MRPSKWLVFIRSRLAGFDRSLTGLSNAVPEGSVSLKRVTLNSEPRSLVRHICI